MIEQFKYIINMTFSLLPVLVLLLVRQTTAAPFSASRVLGFRGHGVTFDEVGPRVVRVPYKGRAGCPPAPPRPAVDDNDHTSFWFHNAHLDNFAPADKPCIWSQRFFVNATWCRKDDCPVFLYIGGEGPLSKKAVGPGLFMHEAAEISGALVVALEHRFFGESWPTINMRTDYLSKYLSSAQALADIARFRAVFHELSGLGFTTRSLSGSPWVGFGGSYPGNLAAWVKVRYPHLFAGTVASSAPLTAQENWPGYMQVVGTALKHFGGGDRNNSNSLVRTGRSGTIGSINTCFGAVSAASADIVTKLSNDAGLAELSTLFLTCGTPMSTTNTSRLDLQTLVSNVVGTWQGLVQYNRPSPRTMSISTMCGELTDRIDGGDSALEAFAAVTLDIASKGITTGYCTEISDSDAMAELKNITFDGKSSMRQWVFMTCNEFGYYQVAGKDAALDPFSAFSDLLDVDMFTRMCNQAYDWEGASPATAWTNSKYGTPNDISAENVTFPSGSLDPWHVLGVTNTSNPVGGASFEMPCTCKLSDIDELPVFIPYTSHCQDMGRCPVGTDGAENCSIPYISWAHKIIHARIAGYLGIGGGGGGSGNSPSPGSRPASDSSGADQTGLLVATAIASLAVGVSLAFIIPKLIICVRRRHGGGRSLWSGVNARSYYQEFGVNAGTDI